MMERTFVHAFTEPLLIVDTAGTVVDINAAAGAMLAYSDDVPERPSLPGLLDVEQRDVEPFIKDAAQSEVFVVWTSPSRANGTVVRLEGVRLSGFEQELILMRVRSIAHPSSESTELDEQGGEEQLHHSTESRLSRSLERYRTLFNGMNDMVIVYHLDDDGRPSTLIDVNEAAVQLLGYSRDELLEKSLADITDPEQVDIRTKISRIRQRGRLTTESCYVAKNGRRISVEVSAHVIDLLGRQTVISVCRDISERKRVEKDVAVLFRREQEARRDAEVAREQLALLVQATSILSDDLNFERTLQDLVDLLVPHLADWCTVTIVDDNGELQRIAVSHHDAAMKEEVLDLVQYHSSPPDAGYGPAAVIRSGRPELVRKVDPEKLTTVASSDAHARILKDLNISSTLTVPIALRDRVLGALTLIYAESGRRYTRHDLLFAEELAGRAAREIENARLFRAVEQSRDEAEEMSRLKSAFLANMSHEIRTPLTSILGFASLLEQRVAEAHRPLAEYIRTGGRRLLETLDAVLALSQLESNMKSFELVPMDVGKVIEEMLPLFEPRAAEKGLSLNVLWKTESPVAYADSGAVTSILQNLIGNAIKFTENGGVDISIRRDGERLWIDVIDTGVGMEPAFTRHLFQPFHQESTGWSRTYEGSGLGLAISKRLLDGMNGLIDVESTKHQGSRFSFSLLAADGADDVETREVPESESENEDANPRILLVEDNPESGMFMEVLLSEYGEVTLVTNVAEAKAAADAAVRPFTILILDINLGNGLTGTDLLEDLRGRAGYADVPAAAVTAYALPGDGDRLIEAGFDAYLAKPFSPDDLTDLAKQLLERSFSK